MAKFPLRRAERDALYELIVAGVAANPADFPSGPGQPFDLTNLNALLAAKTAAVSQQQQDQARARISTKAALTSYEACDEEAKRLFNMAIAVHGRKSPKLRLIGQPTPKTPESVPPGQPRMLKAVSQGPGDLTLDWKSPAKGGGGPAFYKVIRKVRTIGDDRQEGWGEWQASTVASEIVLSGLTRGLEYDFAVVAVNAAGESLPSNMVTVVL